MLFDDPDADTVLVSSEEDSAKPVQFRVHRAILISASPFFRELFELPQPPDSDHGLPVIPMAEPSSILDLLLQLIYPIPDPPLNSLSIDSLSSILAVAFKYDLPPVVSRIANILSQPYFVRHSPMRVYAIATRYDLEDLAKLASSYTLSINIIEAPLFEELKWINAYSYHRLLDLHRQRASSAQKLIQVPPPDSVKCVQCNSSTYSAFLHPEWWPVFQTKAQAALAIKPTSESIFGLEFLSDVIRACGCGRCAQSLLLGHEFLDKLKAEIDALPKTI